MQFEICGDEPLMEPTVPNIFSAIPGKVSKWIHKMIKDDLECSSGNDIQSSTPIMKHKELNVFSTSLRF